MYSMCMYEMFVNASIQVEHTWTEIELKHVQASGNRPLIKSEWITFIKYYLCIKTPQVKWHGHQKFWTLNENFVSSHIISVYKIVLIPKLFTFTGKMCDEKLLKCPNDWKFLKSIFEQFYATSGRFIFIFIWWVHFFFFIVRLLYVRIWAPFTNNIAVVITFYFVIIFDDMYWIFNKRTA